MWFEQLPMVHLLMLCVCLYFFFSSTFRSHYWMKDDIKWHLPHAQLELNGHTAVLADCAEVYVIRDAMERQKLLQTPYRVKTAAGKHTITCSQETFMGPAAQRTVPTGQKDPHRSFLKEQPSPPASVAAIASYLDSTGNHAPRRK